MQIEAGKEEITKYFYRCDLCGQDSVHRRTCGICGRDMCSNCTKFEPRDVMGDYPSRYCSDCFNIGKKYLDLISIEQEKFDATVEKLENEWREEAIKSVKDRINKNSVKD